MKESTCLILPWSGKLQFRNLVHGTHGVKWVLCAVREDPMTVAPL